MNKKFILRLVLLGLLIVLLSTNNTASADSDPYLENRCFVNYYANGDGVEGLPPSLKFYYSPVWSDVFIGDDQTPRRSVPISDVVPTRAGTPLGTYTVTLDANGGNVSTTSISVPYGEVYYFVTWKTQPNGGGKQYSPGGSYYPHEIADLNLYAQWDKRLESDPLTLPTPTREGYTFAGWAKSKTATSYITEPYAVSGNETLYAMWAMRSGNCGNNVRWTLDQNGLLMISGEGDMSSPEASDNWLTNNTDLIQTVVIQNGVTSVSSGAFSNCTKLTSVTIPDSVTSIGSSAFSSCSSLTSVTIPNSVTSIGSSAFSSCSKLKTAGPIGSGYDFQFGWTSSIPNNAFYGCSSLTSVTIPNTVTSIGSNAFYNCSSLTSVAIPDSVTSIGSSAFSSCSSLTSVTIPNSVTSIGSYAFAGCSKLKTAGPIGSGYDFQFGWTSSIPNNAFYGCSSLTSVTIPNTVTSIGSNAFYNCSRLTSVAIPDSVTSIGRDAFSDCGSLTRVTIPDSVTSIANNAFDSNNLKTAGPIGGGYNIEYGWTSSIPANAFYGCDHLSRMTILEGITSIGDSAFYYCSGLYSVTIPESVISIGKDAFYGCQWVDVYISSLSRWCNISFYNGYSNPLSFGDDLYLNGEIISALVIPDGVTAIGFGAFFGYSGLTSVMIPDSVTSIGGSAFSGCSSLTSVTIPNSVTSIGSYAFSGCSELTSVTIPNSVTAIDHYSFQNCTKLKSVTIPDSVTSIGACAFSGCSGLTSVTIPNSVTFINRESFRDCFSLKGITFTGNKPSIDSYSFYRVTATVYYPAENPTYSSGKGNYGGTLTWVADYTYVAVITYDAKGGTAERERDALTKGTSVTPPIPVFDELFFLGWTEDENAAVVQYHPNESLTPTGDMTLYAVWLDLSAPDGILPAALTELEDEALAGTHFRYVRLPNGVTAIGNRVFDGCDQLAAVYVPASVTSIAPDAFTGAPDGLTIIGSAGSDIAAFAAEKGIAFREG